MGNLNLTTLGQGQLDLEVLGHRRSDLASRGQGLLDPVPQTWGRHVVLRSGRLSHSPGLGVALGPVKPT